MANITIRDVAKRADVGVGTVSRVLNDSPNVRAETRERVLAAIAAMDFEPSSIARRLSLGKTHAIGVIAPYFTIPSCVERLCGIESVLSSTGYDFSLFNVESKRRRKEVFTDVPRRERIDGLIIVTLVPPDSLIKRLARRRIPTVLLDQIHPQLSSVSTDNVQGAKMAVEHLIELGHRKIGYISDVIDDGKANPLQFTTPRERYLGYREALESADIPFNPNYHKQGPHAKRYAYELALDLLRQDDPPTAIFAMSDTQAIGALQAAHMLGVKVPDQLSIIGYDDIEVSQHLNLTTIRQPLFDSGVEAVDLLLEQMKADDASAESAEPIHHNLPLELVIRQSTRKPSTQVS